MLISRGIVVANEGHPFDADGKQVEAPWFRAPPQPGGYLVCIPALNRQVRLRARGAADLEFPGASVPAGDHAVHQDARVTHQVGGLRRLPCHIIDCHKMPSISHGSTGLTLGVPSPRIVATSTTPGSSRSRRPSPARRGSKPSISAQRRTPPTKTANGTPARLSRPPRTAAASRPRQPKSCNRDG